MRRRSSSRISAGVLQQAHEESARAGEGVQHRHLLVRQPPAQVLLQGVVGGLQDEIHHLDRRVDDAEALGVLAQRDPEETFVEFQQHRLARPGVVQPGRAAAHAVVKGLERVQFVRQARVLQVHQDAAHGLRNRVALHEVVVAEERL